MRSRSPMATVGWTNNALIAKPKQCHHIYKERCDNAIRALSHVSLSPCTGSRLQLASSSRHWCLHIEQPQAQHPPTSTHLWKSTSPQEVWDLRVSIASWFHHREAQNHSPERFPSPFLAGGMNFPPLSGMLDHWQFSSDTWKLITSIFTWLRLKKKKEQPSLFPYLCSLSLNLSLSG